MRTTVVTTEELASHREWRLFDCRHDLAKPDLGEQQYREAHIAGALFAHLERDLSAPKTGRNGRHPLPDPETFVKWVEQCGVRPQEQVVCYDAANGSMAARLWWMLRWIGHDAVAVLDGGLAKWLAEKRPVTAEIVRHPRSSYPVRLRRESKVGVADVQNRAPRTLLIDARAPARYRGEQEPIDPVAGHIPGAINRFNGDNVNADGTFKPPDVLKKDFEAALARHAPGDVVHYCGSGVSACHNLLAMQIAGLPGGKLFPGSWSEWIADPDRPIAR